MVGHMFVFGSTFLYLGAAVAYSFYGRWGLAIMYYGYAFANLGVLGLALGILR